MLGAIAGDIIGSRFEHDNHKSKDFDLFHSDCRFTDDTVCTVAVADCLLNDGDFAEYLGRFATLYSSRGFGGMFLRWAHQWDRQPYGSYGNGSAMRVSPVAYIARDEGEVLDLAERSAEVTHNHPDAITGAQATALAIWLGRNGSDADEIRSATVARFGYDLSQTVDEIRPGYSFDIRCVGTVPPALVCALEAESFEDAIRNAVSIGGDTDTICAIAGGVAESLFGLPEEIETTARGFLNAELLDVVDRFREKCAEHSTTAS